MGDWRRVRLKAETRRTEPDDLAHVLALGVTTGGLDCSRVVRADLPPGRLVRQVWFGAAYHLFVARAVDSSDVAMLALHALRDHPVAAYEDWDSDVCDAATCDLAREYVEHLSRQEALVLWRSAQPC